MKIKKDEKNGNTLKAAMLTALVIAAGLALLIVVDTLFPFRRQWMRSELAETLAIAQVVFSLLTLGLSAYLLFIYLRDFLELRSEFGLGLVLVMCSFLMYSLTINPAVYAIFGFRPSSPGVFSLIPLIFSLIALGALSWVSSK